MPNKNTQKIPEEIVWKTVNYIQHDRSSTWYLIFGLISLGLIVFGIFTKSILTVITFVAVIASVLTLNYQTPRTLTCKATKTGISYGRTLFPYKIIKTFWILYHPPEIRTLNFETTAYLNNRITIQLENQDPVELQAFLNQYLREDLDREESLTETLVRNLKI